MALNPQQFGVQHPRDSFSTARARTTHFLSDPRVHQLQPHANAATSMMMRNFADPDTAHISIGEGAEYFQGKPYTYKGK